MKKYIVIVYETIYRDVEVEVEAENKEKAREIAERQEARRVYGEGGSIELNEKSDVEEEI